METAKEMQARIVDKAMEDADFRARLLSDPKGAVEQELGVTIPASMSIEVHEEGAEAAHLVLPPDGRLSETEMETVAGAAAVYDENGVRVDDSWNVVADW